jgi:hypothetical protein
LTRGTGHFNFTQGAILTATGVSWSLSMLLAGLIVKYAGYQAAFLSLAAVATAALLIFWTLMPETKPAATGSGGETSSLLHSAAGNEPQEFRLREAGGGDPWHDASTDHRHDQQRRLDANSFS